MGQKKKEGEEDGRGMISLMISFVISGTTGDQIRVKSKRIKPYRDIYQEDNVIDYNWEHEERKGGRLS